nr:hypothetical protein [Candidatus Baldrarchaeota archaeon]
MEGQNRKILVFVEAKFICDKNYITYVLRARERVHRLQKPYEARNSKISAPQNDIEIEVMGTCEDCRMTSRQTSADCGWDEYCGYVCLSYNWWCLFRQCGAGCAGTVMACAACITGGLPWVSCPVCVFLASWCLICAAGCCTESIGPCCLTLYAYPLWMWCYEKVLWL